MKKWSVTLKVHNLIEDIRKNLMRLIKLTISVKDNEKRKYKTGKRHIKYGVHVKRGSVNCLESDR